jgi:hypothetical protein
MNDSTSAGGPVDADAVRARHGEFLLAATANYYERPIVPVRARGSRVEDAGSWSRVSPVRALLAGLMHAMGRIYILSRSVEHP